MTGFSGILIPIAILAFAVVFVFGFKPEMLRFGQSKNKRRNDKQKLTASQKITFQQAQELFKKGQFLKSARLLESIDRVRDAVTILEKGGHIKQAADLLMRIKSPHRAGYILQKHGIYVEAARCFIKADQSFQAAECLKLAGDFQNAASLFEKVNELSAAADCYIELGDHRAAANALVAADKPDAALEQFEAFIDTDPSYAQVNLTIDETNLLVQTLGTGQGDIRFVDFEQVESQIIGVILNLTRSSNLTRAVEIFKHIGGEIGSEMINRKDLSDEDSKKLGELFMQSGSYELAGMLYERLKNFELAGVAFEKATEYARAAYCYERAKMKEKFVEMRIKIAETGDVDKRAKIGPVSDENNRDDKNDNPFAMSENTDFEQSSVDLEVTQVIKPEDINIKFDSGHNLDFPLTFQSNQRLDDLKNWSSVRGSLKEVDFIKDLSDEEKDRVFALGKSMKYRQNELVLDYEDDPLGVYFIIKGSVAIRKRDSHGNQFEVDQLEAPASLGELWLLINRKSNINLIAISEQVEILTTNRKDLMELMNNSGSIAQKIYKCLAQILLERLLNENGEKNSSKVG